MRPAELSDLIKTLAAKQGFERCGIARPAALARESYIRDWLTAGRAGSMQYLHDRLDERLNPALLLQGARSLIVCALSYHQPSARDATERAARSGTSDSPPQGRIASYAWGEDYHVVLKDKLFAMVRQLSERLPEPFDYRVCVDTAPLIEREAAALAGIGWIGKNTLVLNQSLGSYFFLGVIVTTLNIAPDEPTTSHCGSCTACLDACPTRAFPAPFQMDASRCISYLTIEHRGEIDAELADNMGDWLFGCDICQEVCPFNRHAPAHNEPRFMPRPPAPALPVDQVLAWSPEDYRNTLRGTPMKRAKLDMWKRNAAIVERHA